MFLFREGVLYVLTWLSCVLLFGGFSRPGQVVTLRAVCPHSSSGHSQLLSKLLAPSLSVFPISPRCCGSQQAAPIGCTGTCWRFWALRKTLRTWLRLLMSTRGQRSVQLWVQVSPERKPGSARSSGPAGSGSDISVPCGPFPQPCRPGAGSP